jgi:protein-serine/threonine kinase
MLRRARADRCEWDLCRRVELERKLAADTSRSDDRKQKELQAHGRKESAFLRLKRTKLGLDDFRTVKVIGKGAFGEVCWLWQRGEPQVLTCDRE